jgi:hypothetical protein
MAAKPVLTDITADRAKPTVREILVMPKIHHIKKAPKANKAAGIKKGQEFWSGECVNDYFKTRRVWTSPPTAWQLAELEFVEDVLSIQQDMYAARPKDVSDLEDMRDLWVEQIREIADACRETLDNLAEDLRQGPTGQLLEDRADDMDQWVVEVEAVEIDWDDDDSHDGVTWAEHALELIDEMAVYCPE